ncbi:MAG TPA: HEAT repeat domain-containing protein, partial [Polyangiaceae bacterium]
LLRALRARGVPVAERALLVRLLGRTGAVRAGEPLSRVARESTEVLLVLAAYKALGDLGPAGYERVLLEGLDHEDGSVRGAAALSLRRVGSGKVARALLDRLDRPEQDRDAIGIALPGAVARAGDPKLGPELARLLRSTRGSFRDALIEALAATGSVPGLGELVRAREPADRKKLAEVLAGLDAGRGLLATLAKDTDARVRAAAAWSLGSTGTDRELPALLALLADSDPAVASNAAAAAGRVAARAQAPISERLCAALADARSGVRANALAALRLAGAASGGEPCGAGVVARLLRRDPAPTVRAAAARLLAASPGAIEALRRCADQDESSAVARTCAEPASPLPAETEPLLVYVVPMGETDPVPFSPYALALADGTLRLGVADRRGAVFEPRAPKGYVNLELVPNRDAARGM